LHTPRGELHTPVARYLLQRLAGLIFVLFAISVITFTLMHAVPGGPWDATARNPLPEETRTALAHEFGFDRPLYEQYARYMWSALHLNFGVPFESPGETVTALIARTWLVGLTILVVGLAGERKDGLTAAILLLAAFTLYFVTSLLLRPTEREPRRT